MKSTMTKTFLVAYTEAPACYDATPSASCPRSAIGMRRIRPTNHHRGLTMSSSRMRKISRLATAGRTWKSLPPRLSASAAASAAAAIAS
eukprot:4666396-Prymnesium_polylepis.1